MYSNETKNQFVELRAQGLSLDAISSQLSVPKTTLGRWHHESLEQIQRLRALQWHLLEDQIGQRLEDTLGHIAQRIRKWDAKLDGQLTVYQKPGDSIRVIRESRREYLQLRALLLAPLQPARRNAPCLMSIDSEKRVKTGQNPDALDTTPLAPNDLQQPETSMSHFANVEESAFGGASSVEPPIPSTTPSDPPHSPLINTPLQRGEPTQPPATITASAVSPPSDPAHFLTFSPASSPEPTPESATLDAQYTRIRVVASPLPGGEGQGEGQNGARATEPTSPETSTDPNPSPANAACDSGTTCSSALTTPDSATRDVQLSDARACTPPLPRGEGWGEGQTGSSPVPDSAQSKIPNPKSKIDDNAFLGSIVISPYECGAAVVLKTLEQETAHRARQTSAAEAG